MGMWTVSGLRVQLGDYSAGESWHVRTGIEGTPHMQLWKGCRPISETMEGYDSLMKGSNGEQLPGRVSHL